MPREKPLVSDKPLKELSFQPLPAKRTFKEIANQIQDSIYARVLKPGDKLPSERELAAQFNVGRISVREALRMLEQAGLILIKQGSNGGAYVKTMDVSVATDSLSGLMWLGSIQVKDLTEARLAVEKLILNIAIDRMTEDEMKTLGESIKELEVEIKRYVKGESHIHTTPTNFHMLLARATKNPVFEIILKVLLNVTVKVFNLRDGPLDIGRLKKHVASHKAIYKAILNRDLDEAAKKMEQHMLEVPRQYSGNKPTKERSRRTVQRG